MNNSLSNISKVSINGKLFHLGMNSKEFTFLSNVQKQRLEQVWIVIINNALDELVKIQEYDQRKLTIDISSDDQNIIVKFQDNAGGISPNIIENLFEPLVSTKESGGLGIGLNIAKKIVEEQEGNIVAYNQDDGAIFKVTLPLMQKEEV